MITEGRDFRFALGSETDPCSSTWRIWTQGSEAYVAVRSFITVAKLSLHSNGNWQFRVAAQVARYRRPAPHRPGWTRGPGILIPHNDLGKRLPYYDARQGSNIVWLTQPPPRHVAQFAMHFLSEDVPREAWARNQDPTFTVVAALKLRSGSKLCVLRSDRECTAAERGEIAERRRILDAEHSKQTAKRVYGMSLISVQSGTFGQPLMMETQVRPLSAEPPEADIIASAT